ncbi:MAG: hypothetical protein ACFNYQ_08470 [Treponema sp.]|jgi:hypothetical protein|uniref:hypothetical protein n=1 Tax=unclassified Treponema TaxID=2638727 RepID=UPI0020A4F369|nr:hypothetical protein [Treponema sp. OMZ 906]UTC55044.1 hypothetical protein E4N69_09825 [Treponema sp. OMZ 906]
MSYDSVCEQVKTLPESCLEDASKYLTYLLYQYNQSQVEGMSESDEEFSAKMQKGFDEMKNGRVTPLNEAFSEIKRRFA